MIESTTLFKQWLDKQEERSVFYIAFGSVTWFRKVQVEEICKALLELKLPFIWALSERDQGYLLNEMKIID